MKEGFSSFYDYLDPKDLENIGEDQAYSMEAPTTMLFTPEEMGITANKLTETEEAVELMSPASVTPEDVAPPQMAETEAPEVPEAPEAIAAAAEGIEKKASSIWDYLTESDGTAVFQKDAPEIWKSVNGQIIRTTGNVIE